MHRPLSSFALVVAIGCAPRSTNRPPCPTKDLALEVTYADSGQRLAAVYLPSAPPEPLPIGLLLDVELAGDPPARGRCWVEVDRKTRGPGRVELRTRITRVDDEAALRALFETRMLERQLQMCDLVPCGDRRAFETRLRVAQAQLTSAVSIEVVDARWRERWRAPIPGGREELAFVRYVVSDGS